MTVTPSFEQTGSILGDDIQSRLLDVKTALALESSANENDIAALVATAERMCFMMDAIRNVHPVASTVSLNGSPLPERRQGDSA